LPVTSWPRFWSYYLANCLYRARGDPKGAIKQLDDLIRLNPQSHRGYQRMGLLLAASADSRKQLATAEASVSKALVLNPEETGTMPAFGREILPSRSRIW
jgi:tetratricopeptide (TPR) repeat protein